MNMLTTILSFLLTLGVLVIVHEYGHYQVARWCGVKVLRFSVGFGRVVWRRQSVSSATEFTLSALPLGGYVRMLDSREAPVAPGELPQAFDQQPLLRRVAIVSAGPIANFLLAVLLYAVMHWVGLEEPKALLSTPTAGSLADQAGLKAGDWVRAVSIDDDTAWREVASLNEVRWQVTQAALRGDPLRLQVTDATGARSRVALLALDKLGGGEVDTAALRRIGLGGPFREPTIGEVRDGGPAAVAGLRLGDRVLAVDEVLVPDAQWLMDRIRGQVGGEAAMSWRVLRSGQTLDLTVRPRVLDEQGQRIGRIDAFVGASAAMVTVRLGPLEGLAQGMERTWDMSVLSIKMLGRMLIGEASLKNLSGPLTIADYAGQSVQQGWSHYVGFLAMVSISLGVLNLLPLPMLDGGHLMYYLFEGLTGRPVSDSWLKWLQRGGALALLLMMSIALSNDVARLLGLQ
jgi:regulator of sigma E protease